MLNTKFIIRRGDIIYVDFGKTIDSIQGGKRPCVVVANDLCNKYSTSIHVVPLTSSKTKKTLKTHVSIEADVLNNLTKNSTALCESITIISTSQILENIGRLNSNKIKEVDDALKIQLSLKKPDMNRIKDMVSTLKELERYIVKQNNSDLLKILKMEINNFINYCIDFNVDCTRYYVSKFTLVNDYLQNKKIA